MKKYLGFGLIILSLIIFLFSGCNFWSRGNNQDLTINIAEQYGLAYAPVQIMKEKNFLKQENEDIKVGWKQLSNTAAIRESMLAGEVDIGFMAIPPFLIAKDKGMKWKIISGLSFSPLALMTYKQNVHSIRDLDSEDKIVLPQPGSIQHILLSMAAEREWNQADRFDDQLVTMNHPDGMNALLSKKDITAHFTSPPYMFMESKTEGIHKILSGEEALGGEFTFIVGVGMQKFIKNNPELYEDFLQALKKSLAFINNNPQAAVNILSKSYDLKASQLKEYLTWPGMEYTAEIKGLDKFLDFMYDNGYISSKDYNTSQLIEEVQYYEK